MLTPILNHYSNAHLHEWYDEREKRWTKNHRCQSAYRPVRGELRYKRVKS